MFNIREMLRIAWVVDSRCVLSGATTKYQRRESGDTTHPVIEDGARSLEDLHIERVHYTYFLQDFKTFHEDYRYVFRNPTERPHAVLPLLWREREVQANMFVVDAKGVNLIYVPSTVGESIVKKYFRAAWHRFVAASPIEQPEESMEILLRIFSFDVPDNVMNECEEVLANIGARAGDLPEFRAIRRFIRFFADFYIPWVELPRPLYQDESTFLHHGVDIYRIPTPPGLPGFRQDCS